MKKPFQKLIAVLLAAMMISTSSTIVFAAESAPESVAAEAEEDIYAFPDEMPTAAIPEKLPSGSYDVPVYLYNAYQDVASMGNGALTHTATISIENGVATAHLKFHNMPFGDLEGHLENLWYYDAENNRTEVNADKTEWIYNVDLKARIKTLRECSFTMPTSEPVVGCRVQVDAMGDTQQDARLVFDFSSLADYVSKVDVTALEAKIAEAEAIDNSDKTYSEESYNDLLDSVSYAKSFLDNSNATQEDVDIAVSIIQNSIENLVPLAKDKSALEAVVAEASKISNDDGKYTEDSFAKLTQMLQFGNYVLVSDEITQEVYENVLNALQAALNGLEEVSSGVDTSALEAKIAEAEAIDNSDKIYSEESYNDLLDSVSYAKSFLDNSDATQEDVDIAVSIIQNSIENLVPLAKDKSALQAVVDEASKISNDDGKYTEDSFARLTQMLQFGNYVLISDEITQEVYENVLNALQAALDGLTENGQQPVTVDTSKLEKKIAEAETYSNEDDVYTEESFEVLTSAIVKAKETLADTAKTQESVDAAVTELQNAIDGLVSSFAVQQKEWELNQLRVWLERAKIFANDNRFTEDTLKTLNEQIERAENILADSEATPWYEINSYLLRNAVYNLHYVDFPKYEDGSYTANMKFYERSLSNYSVSEEESEIAKKILGNQIQVDVEGDSIEITFKGSLVQEFDNYYIEAYGVRGDDNMTKHDEDKQSQKAWTEVDINGTKTDIQPLDYTQSYFVDLSKRNYIESEDGTFKEENRLLLTVRLLSKDDTYVEGVGFKPVRMQFLVDIDFDNMVKTGEITVDKTELADEIEFAELLFEQGLDDYTEATVNYYADMLKEAKRVYDDLRATTREVKEAKDNLYNAFQYLAKKDDTVMIGDVNGDGKVNISDVTAIQRHLAEFVKEDGTPIIDENDETQLLIADADGDGRISIEDATTIQRYLAELIDKLGKA